MILKISVLKKVEFVYTPLFIPIAAYLLIYIIATFLGIMAGDVKFNKGIFYLLKYIEYFLIYFLVTNIITENTQVKTYIILFILTAVIVNLYGYSLIGKVDRIYTPFDTPSAVIGGTGTPVGAGEANTYGGYLLIVLSLAISLLCYSQTLTQTVVVTGFIIFSIVPFAYTLSRSSYFGFFWILVTILMFTTQKKFFLLGSIILITIFAPIVFKKPTQVVVERIQQTFVSPVPGETEEVTILGMKIKELSALARVDAWKRAFNKFLRERPILGYGVTGAGLVDTQIPLIIGEVGLVGLFCFLWMIYTIYKEGYKLFVSIDDPLCKSIALSVISSLTGLLFQSVGANTFIIIRIMGPFWFLCGIMFSLKNIIELRKVEI